MKRYKVYPEKTQFQKLNAFFAFEAKAPELCAQDEEIQSDLESIHQNLRKDIF